MGAPSSLAASTPLSPPPPPPTHRAEIEHAADRRHLVSSSSFSHDLVIVGAGPSAIGLVSGLLRRCVSKSCRGAVRPSVGSGRNDVQRRYCECAVPNLTIAVIERGGGGGSGDGDDLSAEAISDPRRWFEASHFEKGPSSPSSSRPLLYSAPQAALSRRVLSIPVGSGWGGGSNVNACLLCVPSEDDFDGWPGRWGGKDGRIAEGIREVLCSVKEGGICGGGGADERRVCDIYRSVCGGCDGGEHDLVGGGLFGVSAETSSLDPASFPAFVSFVATSTRSIFRWSEDGEIAAPAVIERVNYFDSVLRPLLDAHPILAESVTFLGGTLAERVTIDEMGRASGVECRPVASRGRHGRVGITEDGRNVYEDSKVFVVSARREIILCAGALLSPALLIASGIGPIELLEREGIPQAPLSCQRWGERRDADDKCRGREGKDRREEEGAEGSLSLHEGVGWNLHDHVVVPRAFVTPSLRWSRKSINAVQGWYNAEVLVSQNSPDDVDSGCGHGAGRARRFQLTLTDGAASSQLVPYFIAGVLRRRFGASVAVSADAPSSLPGRLLAFACAGIVGSVVSALNLAFSAAFLVAKTIFSALLNRTPLHYIALHHTATMNVCLLDPYSRGSVSLRRRHLHPEEALNSASSVVHNTEEKHEKCPPYSSPKMLPWLSDFDVIVDPAYLSDSRDVDALKEAWNGPGEVVRCQFFGRCWEVLPGLIPFLGQIWGWVMARFLPCFGLLGGDQRGENSAAVAAGETARALRSSSDWFRCYVANFASPYFHWSGTCAMGDVGNDETMGADLFHERNGKGNSSVVDEYLCVRGVQGLRVCDASIAPTPISCPTALACAGLGNAAAALLDEERGDRVDWDYHKNG